jgi:polysaccharide biosynthesis protein PslH
MKILQLCKKFPFPYKDGEAIAVTNLSKAMKELGAEVTLLTMNTSKHFMDLSQLPSTFTGIYKEVHAVEVYNHITPWGGFVNLFQKEAYHVTRFISREFEQKLIELLTVEDFDIIQLETIYLTPYIDIIRKNSKASISIRAHNVEHEIWKRVADISKFKPKKWYLYFLTAKLRRFEIENIKKGDILLPITERDARIFKLLGYRKNLLVTPVGLDHRDYKPDKSSFSKTLSLGFIGSLDWMPNQDGLMWFLNEVWSKCQENEQLKKVVLHIAGRNAPNWLKNLNIKNVVFQGEIDDAQAFINQHSIIVVPLLSGSGIRVKILESMMLGKVVITTSLGLEGIPATKAKEVLVADSVVDFVNTLLSCVEHPNKLESIGQAASDFSIHHFDNLTIANRVLSAYENIVFETACA